MKIALLHPHSWPEVRRGGERYARDLTWWLARQGHEVDYVTGAAAASIEEVDGARIIRLAHHHRRRLDERGFTPLDTFGLTVLPWLARHRYDVVHALVPAAAIAAAITRQRVVYSAIGHPESLKRPDRRKDRWLFRRAVRSARVPTALSGSAADAALELTGVRPRVLHPGLRLDVFNPQLRPRAIDAPDLLFAADADDPRKRLRLVLDAMPAVLDAVPNARLVMGGPGRLPDSIDQRVRAAIVTPGVGTFEDVARRFRDASVTVLPSVNEAFGLVLVESLACGTPVVATDSGSMPEIVTPEVGALAKADDADSLARAIIDVVALAGNPATPPACAEHAKQWGWDVVGPQHVAAYADAMRK